MCISRMLECSRCLVAGPAEEVGLALASIGQQPLESAYPLPTGGSLWAGVGLLCRSHLSGE